MLVFISGCYRGILILMYTGILSFINNPRNCILFLLWGSLLFPLLTFSSLLQQAKSGNVNVLLPMLLSYFISLICISMIIGMVRIAFFIANWPPDKEESSKIT